MVIIGLSLCKTNESTELVLINRDQYLHDLPLYSVKRVKRFILSGIKYIEYLRINLSNRVLKLYIYT